MGNQAMQDPAPVKITDVAAAAGVAPMTVSRVLNTPNRVSAATALRVRDAIDRLGYVPNMIAGGLSSRRSRMIAAVVPTIASPMFSAPVQSFTDALGRAGYHVMLSLSGYADDAEDLLIPGVLARRPDGLLLTGTRHSDPVRRLVAHARIPVVELWDVADAPIDTLVGFDHAEVGAAVADFFLADGHTRFAVLAAQDPRAAARRQGFERRVAAHGGTLVAGCGLPSPSTILDARAALAGILPLLDRRTALFGSSDLIAFGAITEARRAGIDVPRQLAVCGFGDFELSRATEPPFTTVSVDGRQMGQHAAANLLRRIAGEPVEARIVVPFRIQRRAST